MIAGGPMTEARLTDELAARVLHWKVAPDRFVKDGRRWVPRWRFQPMTDLDAAFQLLDGAADSYAIGSDGRMFRAEVKIGARTGTASGNSKPRTITYAIARALQLEVP